MMNKKLSVHFSALILVAISLSACIGASGKPSGTIAYLKHDYSVWIVNEDGSNPTQLIAGGNDFNYMPISFSPDGTWLLIGKSGSEPSWLTFSEYFLFNIKNPTTLVPISTPGTYINSLEWSPDSQSIAITSSPIEESTDWIHGITGRSLSILSLKTNQLTKITENVISYSWNPQGKQIAYTQGFDTLPQEFTFFMPLNIVNMDSATVEKTIPTCEQKGGNTAFRLAWSPDGKTILVSCLDSGRSSVQRYAINLASGMSSTLLTEEFSGATAFAEFLTWSPDGKKILVADGAFDSGDAGSSMQVLDLEQDNSHLVSNDPTLFLFVGYAPWSPDSKKLLSLCFIRDSQTHSTKSISLCVMDQNGDNFKDLANIILNDVDWPNKSAQDKSQVKEELIHSFEDITVET